LKLGLVINNWSELLIFFNDFLLGET